jgi:hypothetical protein
MAGEPQEGQSRGGWPALAAGAAKAATKRLKAGLSSRKRPGPVRQQAAGWGAEGALPGASPGGRGPGAGAHSMRSTGCFVSGSSWPDRILSPSRASSVEAGRARQDSTNCWGGRGAPSPCCRRWATMLSRRSWACGERDSSGAQACSSAGRELRAARGGKGGALVRAARQAAAGWVV